jgi:hypothetical protein
VWPLFRPQDRVRIRASGLVGEVNQIEPNERGNGWLFEVVLEQDAQTAQRSELSIGRVETATCEADELELVEASGLEHEAEITLRLETSSADAAAIADSAERLAAETFVVAARAHSLTDQRVLIELWPRDHPRDGVRDLMKRVGHAWLVEDDGWYANVHWVGDEFPVAGVDQASVFLRPWRDPRSGRRLPGDPHE